jgi:NAD(P)-dependent dehydrogenase (short-subunit alcohol dehydrogenase family)
MNAYYEHQVAVVTGGASGIGLALCELILSFGAKAVILADLNAEKLENERERLEASSGSPFKWKPLRRFPC